ncbi:hypothetical protein NNX28_17020 [Arthrobacter sp. zg-Y859]|uniref:Rhodanese domain-containing protein n=1 Tax=Arthrobacter jinronghuae TaxID=2964609 RepID=A0ABT1NV62_9MICC|nr:phage tail tape measure protein [Arthrobacter jinronghuae]MCQ1951622.1 hypothetical protein [Arthrobacter jinronghuae]UWX79664.1 hypothetical protein N2K98_05560 [Arthrobacter jinronghuae]
MALNIGQLFGTLGLDATSFDRELVGAQDNLKAFGVAGAAVAAAAAVAIGAALSKGIADAIDMEAGNDRVQAQLGLTEEQAAVSGKAAGSVFSQNFGESMEEVQVGVSAVMSSIKGMRDASQADVEDMTKRMLTLADVFEIDVSRAAQVAGQMITSGFATDGVHAADLLTNALQKVPAAVREDILDAVDEYGPFMAQLGIAAETGMGLLVNASDKGMYGIDKLGDALKEFTIRSTDMSTASGAAYEALGMDQQEMSNKLLAGGVDAQTAFGDIIHGLQEIEDPSARAAAAIALFGTPLEDLGVNEIPEFLGQIDPMGDAFDSVAGASDKAMADVASNAKAGFEGFKRQAQTALIDFVNVNIMPTLSTFAGFLNNTVGPAVTQLGAWVTANALPALQAFGNWFSQNQGTIGIIATVIGALLIPVFIRLAVQAALTAAAHVTAWALMSAGAVKAGALYVAQSYRMIGSFVATAASMAVTAAGVVAGWVLMGAQALIQGARMAAGWILAMGPIGWIITAVVALVALVIANWDKVSAFTSAAWSKITGVLSGFWNNTVGMFKDFWGHITGAVSAAWDKVQSIIGVAWTIISTIFTTYISVVTTIFKAGWEIIQTVVATVLAVIIAIFTGKFGEIGGLVSSGWNKIVGFFGGAMTAIWGLVQGMWAQLVNITRSIWEPIVGFFTGLWDGVKAIFTAVWDFIVGYYMTVWGLLTGQSTGAADQVRQIIANAFEAVKSFIMDIWNGIIGFLAGAWENIKSTTVNVFNAIVDFVASIPGRILSGLAAIGGFAIQMGQWVLSMKDAAVDKFLGLVGWVKELPGKILDALGNMGSLLKNAGVQIITGFLDGLKQKYEDVKNFVGGIGDWIADHKGPKAYDLALLVPAGGWIMTGLQEGLRSQMGALKGTLGDVSSMIETGIQPELAVTGSYAGTGGWADQRDYGFSNTPAPVHTRTSTAYISIPDSTTPRATAVKVARVLEGAV